MSKPLIYLIAVFALWLYFRYGNFSTGEKIETAAQKIEKADAAGSGFGGVRG